MYQRLLLIVIFGILSCEKGIVKNEDLDAQLLKKLCITDISNYKSITKKENYNNIEGTVLEKRGVDYAIYYIKINDNLYSSCQIPDFLKRNGMKVILDGTSYQLIFNCEAGNPCGILEAFPLFITKIDKN